MAIFDGDLSFKIRSHGIRLDFAPIQTLKTFTVAVATAMAMSSAHAQIGDLLWEDNFDTLNSETWTVDIGDGCSEGLCGWGNLELQSYGESNVYIAPAPGEEGNNALVLEARDEVAGASQFTSGKVKSANNIALQYGMIEYRVMMPSVDQGLWPAVWMLGTSTATWPRKGEIDMMEMGHSASQRADAGFPEASMDSYVGANVIRYADDACTTGNPSCAASAAWQTDNAYLADTPLSNRFVTYRTYWTDTEIRFTVFDQGIEYDLFDAPVQIPSDDPDADALRAPYYFLMNLAVGGNFTDAAVPNQITAPRPAKMFVDYLRVYQYNGLGEIIEGGAPPETGVFGIFTDTTPTTNELVAGVSSDIFVWDLTTSAGSTAPNEGENVIAWNAKANNWFGGGVQSRQPLDLSNFSEGTLNFKIKIPANVGFQIGVTDTFTNQNWLDFPAGESVYGMVRDGEWTDVSIPVSDLRGASIAMQSLEYPFAILSFGQLSPVDFDFALDDIYYDSGLEPPVDSDGDGIIDANDLCPATPAGVEIDETGCEIIDLSKTEILEENGQLVGGPDSLKPGFKIYVNSLEVGSECSDRCMERFERIIVEDGKASTAEGLGLITLADGREQASYNGRALYFALKDSDPSDERGVIGPFIAATITAINALDTDSDGISDIDDLCPGSPRFFDVNSDGCPLDPDREVEVAVVDGLLVGGIDSAKPGFTLYRKNETDCTVATRADCERFTALLSNDGGATGASELDLIEISARTLQVRHQTKALYFSKVDNAPGDLNGLNDDFALAEIIEGPGNGWSLVWSDEFDGDAIDTAKWGWEENCWGGGNSEQQCYTSREDNSFVDNGFLNIIAQREDFTGPNTPDGSNGDNATLPYTSARLRTKDLQEWTFGRFEIRAKLPEGQGTWPAIWMLPTDSPYGTWASSGEIDIVEAVNLKVDGESEVHGTLHYGRNWPDNVSSGDSYTLPDGTNPADGFHTYAVEWEEGEIRWYVDGVHFSTQRSDGWYSQYTIDGDLVDAPEGAPYDAEQSFHMLLNLAVGGDWAANTNQGGIDEAAFPQSLQVDYVRVFECSIDPATGKGCATVDASVALNPGNNRPDLGPGDSSFAEPPLYIMFDDSFDSGIVVGSYDPDSAMSITTTGEDGRGEVLQLVKGTNLGNMFFNVPSGNVDLSAWLDQGELAFDIKVNSMDEGAQLYAKLDSGWPNVSDVNVTLPELGTWGEFRIPIATLLANGNSFGSGIADITSIANIFVAEPTAPMDVMFDNIRFELGEPNPEPTPTPTPTPTPNPDGELVVYGDSTNGDWQLWDCCGGASISEVSDIDPARGTVAEFSFNSAATVSGFNLDTGIDTSSYAGGTLEFDFFLDAEPLDPTAEFRLKLEGADGSFFVEVLLNDSLEGLAPTLGQWQHFSFDLDTLNAQGSWNLDTLRIIMIFPDWGRGDGAVFRIDNLGLRPLVVPGVDIYTDALQGDWTLWDCCGGSTIIELDDADAARGTVVQFNNNAAATVSGFLLDTSIDISEFADGTLEFDFFLEAEPLDPTAEFRLKLEGPDGSFFSEVVLSQSREAMVPLLGQWQHFTFDIDALNSAGSWDPSALRIVMIFPDWGRGDGAIYRIDALRIAAGSSIDPEPNPEPSPEPTPDSPFISTMSNGDVLLQTVVDFESGTSLMFMRINGVQSEPTTTVTNNGNGTYTHSVILTGAELDNGDLIDVRFFIAPIAGDPSFIPGPTDAVWSDVFVYDDSNLPEPLPSPTPTPSPSPNPSPSPSPSPTPTPTPTPTPGELPDPVPTPPPASSPPFVDANDPNSFNLLAYGAGNISDAINPAGYGCVVDFGTWVYNAGIVESGVNSCDPIGTPTSREPQVIGAAALVPTPTHKWWGSIPFHGEMAIGNPADAAYITPDPISARISNMGVRVTGIPAGLAPTTNGFMYQVPDPFSEVFEGIAVGNTLFSNLDAYLKDYSDGSVTVQWQDGVYPVMEATFVHGSPYVYFQAYQGDLVVRTKATDGGEKGTYYSNANSLGVWTNVAGLRNNFLVTGEGETAYSNITGNEIVVSNTAKAFTLTLLPGNAELPNDTDVAFFETFARAVVADVTIDYSVNQTNNAVTVTHQYSDASGEPVETLAGMHPMHWKNSSQATTAYQVRSARGTVKFSQTDSFAYDLSFVGVLPYMPSEAASLDQGYLESLVQEFMADDPATWNTNTDTYWSGKNYSKVAELAAIARSIGLTDEADQLVDWLKAELSDWFRADTNGSLDTVKYFVYDQKWHTLLGLEESFGSHQQLNDHHFHYGYFVRAAAEICRVDVSWCSEDQYGPMVELLIRDYAGDKDDPMFPSLRNFDPANGFSWASGNANFVLGNNNESTSEAANSYGSIVLYGLITGNEALVEKGMYLHASTTTAYWEYWNNIDRFLGTDAERDNFPASYDEITTSIIWGQGAVFSTWFSGANAHILGIQGLPTNPLNLHIGQYADYMIEYVAVGLAESSNGKPSGLVDDQWRDIWWNLWSMTDADAAIADYEAVGSSYDVEAGETKAHTYQWLQTFKALGHINAGTGKLNANVPTAVAFTKDGTTRYVAYNYGSEALDVSFSDGHSFSAEPNGFTISTNEPE
ncbi:MAG: endo-1,3(4)-beta-glucanase [Flavobacteriales bacterium]|jgi:endo-1,3(4)-beta-glucanase